MADEKAVIAHELVANGWIAGCYQLVVGVALVGVNLVSEKLVYDEDIKEWNNKREISIQVDFLDDGMVIGQLILTRINETKTHIQVLLDPLPDSRMFMYDLRGKNGELKKRFEKIKEVAPTTVESVFKAIVKKLDAHGLLENPPK